LRQGQRRPQSSEFSYCSFHCSRSVSKDNPFLPHRTRMSDRAGGHSCSG
jgi:hypothetical protein